MPIRKRLALISIGIALALIAGELLLQGISYARWMANSSAPVATVDDGKRCILCVGDSYTFGLGAEQSELECYPAELQRMVVKEGVTDLRVVKDAWPSRDSREVLLRLGDQLDRHKPERVYILVGMNDFWGEPTELVQPSDLTASAPESIDDGFPIRWRTGRLLALISQWLADESPLRPEDGPAFLGTWTAGALEVTFFANGRMLFSPNVFRWHEDGSAVVITEDGVEQNRYQWQIVGESLILKPGDGKAAMTLGRGSTSKEMLEQNAKIPAGTKSLDHSQVAKIDPLGPRPIDALTEQLGDELGPKREVLAKHLELMIEQCRKHAAVPVLLSYPWDVHCVRGVPAAVAKRLEVEYVNFLPHFEHLLLTVPAKELYIPDGHCTARGYAEMAGQLLKGATAGR